MIVEDHVSVGEALRTALGAWFEMLELVPSLPTLRVRLMNHQPDVVLLDLAVGGQNALEWLPNLTRDFPGIRIVVLTAYDERSLVTGARKAGARGFLVKSATLQEIRVAIETVMEGKTHFAALEASVPPSRRPANAPRLPGADLLFHPTPRQQEILELLRAGSTMRNAARALGLHPRTIEYHLASLGAKLGGAKRAGILQWYEEYQRRRREG
jgi:two-component system, NarL family, nitrate/nitrite response regulator NarL